MLADSEARSVVTAAQSGATRDYHLLALQFLFIPLVQELTIRLRLTTGMGHRELLRRFGRVAAHSNAIQEQP
jgi:Mn2+/Fe2+ NRAMP family transporter